MREGCDVPFHELGYVSFMQYLESIPDTVVCQFVNGVGLIAVPVRSHKSAHIGTFVQKKKYRPPK
jgi:hypothetical protein